MRSHNVSRKESQLAAKEKFSNSSGKSAAAVYDRRSTEATEIMRESQNGNYRRFLPRVAQVSSRGAQTNDIQLTLLLYDTFKDIKPDLYLFADSGIPTTLDVAGAIFRKR